MDIVFSCSQLILTLTCLVFFLFISDFDECADQSKCKNGHCINTDGSYRCECRDGYTLLPNGAECFDMREETCFMEYKDGFCNMSMRVSITRMKCCCSMGAAWGFDCIPCPAKTTSKA